MKPEYTQKLQNHHHLPPQAAAVHHPYQMAAGGAGSREDDVSTKRNNELMTAVQPISAAGGSAVPSDGATIEISRRRRGRPPGSKNRPKPPVVITVDSQPTMSPYIFELPIGVDLIGSVTRFCKKRNTGLCILTGSGTVTNVTLRQPSTAPVPNVTIHGRFDILSISTTILPVGLNGPIGPQAQDFVITLSGPQGQVFGGPVVGPLKTAGPVYLIGATFNSPSYEKLPENKDSVAGDEGSPPRAAEESGGAAAPAPEETRGLSMFNGHMMSDVMWAQTARQAPPPY